jgi:membrane protein YdbS with pleckstrin-like domain
MANARFRRAGSWVGHHLLWDTTDTTLLGIWKVSWATRKLIVAIMGAALLTWLEWIEHHPPAIVIIALIHFVFVFAVIDLVVYIGRRFNALSRAVAEFETNLRRERAV